MGLVGLLRISEREARRIGAEDVDDVVQEALARAWRARRACANGEAPQAWMAQIARREALRAYAARRRRGTVELTDAELEAPGGDALDELASALDVRRALADLPAGDRELVELRYQRDLTHPAIAKLTGRSLSSVKVRLHRARNRLRVTLAEA